MAICKKRACTSTHGGRIGEGGLTLIGSVAKNTTGMLTNQLSGIETLNYYLHSLTWALCMI